MGNVEILIPIRLSHYSGYLLQEDDISAFREQLEKFCSSGLNAQSALTAYPDREVYRVKINAGSMTEIYIKRYFITSVKQIFQVFFYAHKAQKSWRIARILQRKGILTPRSIALLHRRTSWYAGEYLLITEGITKGLSLREYVQRWGKPTPAPSQEGNKRFGTPEEFLPWRGNKRVGAPTEFPSSACALHADRWEGAGVGCFHYVELKRNLLRRVAEFLGALHLAGVYHGDLTANNIFIEPQNGEFQVYLIDLDSVRSTYWISDRRRIKNLDELGRNFLDLSILSTTDRLRFLKHYLHTYTKETRTLRELFYEVLARTRVRLQKHQQQFMHSRNPTPRSVHSESCPERNRRTVEEHRAQNQSCIINTFSFEKEPGWQLQVFPAWRKIFQTLEEASQFLSNPARMLQAHNRGEIFLLERQGTLFIAKRSLTQERRRWVQFTSWYRRGEGVRTLQNMAKLYDLGLPVPEPVFVLEKKRFGFVLASWSVYRYLDGTLCTCAEAERIARMLRTLHQHGWVHRDPHVKNFLLHNEKIRMIDCTRARPWRSRYAQMYDVVLLNKCCPGSRQYYGISDNDWIYRLAQWQCSLFVFWRRIKRTLRFWKK